MTLHMWLTSTQVRHYPHTPVSEAAPLILHQARNEQASFQVVLRLEAAERQRVRVVVEPLKAAGAWEIRVRRVGYVPVPHYNPPLDVDNAGAGPPHAIPGYVPDPLFDEDAMLLPQAETHAFWVTLYPDGVDPGDHTFRVRVIPEEGTPVERAMTVRVYDLALEPRQDFHITHWFYVDALIDWYGTSLFDARFWEILPAYVRDVVAHGQDTLYVPVFTPPLDGVKRPSQLLRILRSSEGDYRFYWRDVKRYVDLARASGITHFEWCHLFTQWGAANAIRIYEGQGEDEQLLWPPETAATSATYRGFLAQFLPALYRFLHDEGLLDRSFFHVSDEPHVQHLAQYRDDRAMLRELAPWMKVMDALSDVDFARQGLTDMPIPSIRTALDFVQEGIPSWCYYCCGPRGPYLNRLMDTPLPKIAMHGLLFYRWPFGGFLHWGYNYWYASQTRTLIDPFVVSDGLAWERGWAYGDTFEVYPGSEGPIDSVRWEVFGESLQDYRLLQTLGVPRDHPLLAPIHSFADFPKTAGWRVDLREQLLRSASVP